MYWVDCRIAKDGNPEFIIKYNPIWYLLVDVEGSMVHIRWMMKHDKEHPLNSSSETLNYPMGNFRQYRYAKRALKFAF